MVRRRYSSMTRTCWSRGQRETCRIALDCPLENTATGVRIDRIESVVSERLIKPWLNRCRIPLKFIRLVCIELTSLQRFHENLRNSNEYSFFRCLLTSKRKGIDYKWWNNRVRYRRERERTKEKGRKSSYPFVMQRPRGFPPFWEILCWPIVQFHVSFLKLDRYQLHDRSSILFVDHVRLRSTDHFPPLSLSLSVHFR